MFKVFGEHYYLDLEVIEEYTKIAPNVSATGETENHIHIVKYETIKFLIESPVRNLYGSPSLSVSSFLNRNGAFFIFIKPLLYLSFKQILGMQYLIFKYSKMLF